MMEDLPQESLSRQELLAVRIGIADAACGCREPAAPRAELGWFARVMLWLLGDHAPRPLASPRLEVVRRFVCATRAGHQPGAALMSELQKLGLQPAHLATLANLLN